MLQDRGAMLTGLGIGAGLMFLLDPGRGTRRRALARDKVVRAAHVAGDAADATARDLANRVSGAVARLDRARHDEPADDAVLVERVRARLGRIVSHPHAIVVEASAGTLTLKGPILETEVSRLCRAVERVRGVRKVVNALEAHEDGSHVPALQGGTITPGSRWVVHPKAWSPTARAVTMLVATAGVGLLARAAAGHDERWMRH